MDKSTIIVSPVTKGPVKLLFNIPKEIIIHLDKSNVNIDVSYLFYSVETISLYECLDTGYRFFYPFEKMETGHFMKNWNLFLGITQIGSGTMKLQRNLSP